MPKPRQKNPYYLHRYDEVTETISNLIFDPYSKRQ